MDVRLVWGDDFEIVVYIPDTVSQEDFFTIVDRLEYLIKRGHKRLSPEVIEEQLRDLEARAGIQPPTAEAPSIERIHHHVRGLQAKTQRLLELLDKVE